MCVCVPNSIVVYIYIPNSHVVYIYKLTHICTLSHTHSRPCLHTHHTFIKTSFFNTHTKVHLLNSPIYVDSHSLTHSLTSLPTHTHTHTHTLLSKHLFAIHTQKSISPHVFFTNPLVFITNTYISFRHTHTHTFTL
jgi:hypothetical protein